MNDEEARLIALVKLEDMEACFELYRLFERRNYTGIDLVKEICHLHDSIKIKSVKSTKIKEILSIMLSRANLREIYQTDLST